MRDTILIKNKVGLMHPQEAGNGGGATKNVIIMGAAGRDFHNFNLCFKDDPRYRVIAFTAAQIPAIADRLFPPALAGSLYPAGIPIFPEEQLVDLIRRQRVDLVAFSYSDLAHVEVMHLAAIVTAAGADFILIGNKRTMLEARKPVLAVCGVRTGCGKSQTTRRVCEIVRELGHRVVVVRHPMPYGDLKEQVAQRFSSYEDFRTYRCTIEEREEYEPLVEQGITVFGGLDFSRILEAAEAEADVIVWDGGNNDTPFFCPDIHIVVFDPLRAGHELLYYPGETNMLLADIAVINKVNTAPAEKVERVRQNIRQHNAGATIVLAESPFLVSRPAAIRGKRVLVVEDGPSLTHGEMEYGAGELAARKYEADEVVDPRPYATGSIKETFHRYPHIGPVLPTMGYGREQIYELEQTINRSGCDLVLFATPIHLPRLLSVRLPTMRVRYEYCDHGQPSLKEVLVKILREKGVRKREGEERI